MPRESTRAISKGLSTNLPACFEPVLLIQGFHTYSTAQKSLQSSLSPRDVSKITEVVLDISV